MLYPLRFQPLFRRYLWGGRRLESHLGKQLGPGDDYAESWEIVDRGKDQSVVTAGPLAGQTLKQLLKEFPSEMLGRHSYLTSFPLLFKFLDCHRTLSVQVHPNDAQAVALEPPDLGKTEAWVVIDTKPDSKIYAGLRAGVDHDTLVAAIGAGTIEDCLHSFHPQPGDCVFIPAGLVHALGAGLLVAEIQQSSDTTFRLFDWNRVDRAGHSRELHIAAALRCTQFDWGAAVPQVPRKTESPHRERLVECEQFVLDRLSLENGFQVGGDDRFHLLAVLRGSLNLTAGPVPQTLTCGTTVLLPASVGRVDLQPSGKVVLLDIYLP